MIRPVQFPLGVCAFVLAAAIGAPAWGQDSDTDELRKEVEALKQKVQKLEEQQAAKPEAGGAATSPQQTPRVRAAQLLAGYCGSPQRKRVRRRLRQIRSSLFGRVGVE